MGGKAVATLFRVHGSISSILRYFAEMICVPTTGSVNFSKKQHIPLHRSFKFTNSFVCFFLNLLKFFYLAHFKAINCPNY